MTPSTPDEIFRALHDAAATSGLSGVIRLDADGTLVGEAAFGLADRAFDIAATPQHRFSAASVAKGFTALAIGALIDDGVLTLDSLVRPVLGTDLPLIDDGVTVGHLLAHTSGIGDYLDESVLESSDDYVLAVPVHTLDRAEAYLSVLDSYPQVSEPGATFAYNNGGFVVLALVAERVSGVQYQELVHKRVFEPAGMEHTDFPRTDELGGDVARGYLAQTGLRTNVLHLPVQGIGDGGAVTTVADLALFWRALLDGRIVSADTLAALTTPVSELVTSRYARGFWRGKTSERLSLVGGDAGISAGTWHDPATGITTSVLSNTAEGAWPVLRAAPEAQ